MRPKVVRNNPAAVTFCLTHIDTYKPGVLGKKTYADEVLVVYGNTVETTEHAAGHAVSLEIEHFYPYFYINVDGWSEADVERFVEFVNGDSYKRPVIKWEIVEKIPCMGWCNNQKSRYLKIYYRNPTCQWQIYRKTTKQTFGVLKDGFSLQGKHRTIISAEDRESFRKLNDAKQAIILLHYERSWSNQLLTAWNQIENEEKQGLQLQSILQVTHRGIASKGLAQYRFKVGWNQVKPAPVQKHVTTQLMMSLCLRVESAHTRETHELQQPDPKERNDRILSISTHTWYTGTSVGPSKEEIEAVKQLKQLETSLKQAQDEYDRMDWEAHKETMMEQDEELMAPLNHKIDQLKQQIQRQNTYLSQCEQKVLGEVHTFADSSEKNLLQALAAYMKQTNPDIFLVCNDWQNTLHYLYQRALIIAPEAVSSLFSKFPEYAVPIMYGKDLVPLIGRQVIEYNEVMSARNNEGLDPKFEEFFLRAAVHHPSVHQGYAPPEMLTEIPLELSLLPPEEAIITAAKQTRRDVVLLSALEAQGDNMAKFLAISAELNTFLSDAASRRQQVKITNAIYRMATRMNCIVNKENLYTPVLKVPRAQYNSYPPIPEHGRPTRKKPSVAPPPPPPAASASEPLLKKRRSIPSFMARMMQSAQVPEASNKKSKKKPKSKHGDDVESYRGGKVWEPIADFYEDYIATLDFASLYPSIMLAMLLDFTTIVFANMKPVIMNADGTFKDEFKDHLLHSQIGDSDLSYTFCRKPGSFTPILLTLEDEGLKRRKLAKKQMKVAETQFEKSKWNGIQLALKILCNAIYGYTGVDWDAGAELPCKAIASTICEDGQYRNTQTGWYVTTHFPVGVIYGDTDSVLIQQLQEPVYQGTEIERRKAYMRNASQYADEITEVLFGKLKPHLLENEGLLGPVLFFNNEKGQGIRKCYAGFYYEKSMEIPDKIKCQGLPHVKRDRCWFVRDIGEYVLRAMLEKRFQDLKPFLTRKLDRLKTRKIDISQLSITSALKSKYKDDSAKIQVETAKRIQQRTGRIFPNGSRIRYTVVETNTDYPGDKITFRGEDPDYVLEMNLKVDLLWVLNSQLRNPLITLTQHVDKNIVNVKQLLDQCEADIRGARYGCNIKNFFQQKRSETIQFITE